MLRVCVCVTHTQIYIYTHILTPWKDFSSFLFYLPSPPVTTFTQSNHVGKINDNSARGVGLFIEKLAKISTLVFWESVNKLQLIFGIWTNSTVITKGGKPASRLFWWSQYDRCVITPTVRATLDWPSVTMLSLTLEAYRTHTHTR